jgi:hypothetical protein
VYILDCVQQEAGEEPTIVKINILKCIRVNIADLNASRNRKLFPVTFDFGS